ncbi:sulfotransferase domain-containing protein [Amylibacter sp. SFDW26]|uniref:sulfotransferase domain-containing protein n=1 Tax=Amylibacter sp. SFDW26 TaxID=2652722 RepID=UPI001D01F3BA|nr:sulfotransferase domain-containing protein [Amylibacter sp. SFDW26]
MQQRNIIWIGSYPKSGNTWVRSFLGNYFQPTGKELSINELSSITTSDVRKDWFNKAAGGEYTGTGIDDWIIMRSKVLKLINQSTGGNRFVKTHSKIANIEGYHLIAPEVTAAAICIIRNPFDVAVSFARHLNVPHDEVIDRLCDPMSITSTDNGILEALGRWDDHVQSWTKAPGLPRHLMRYEDMVDNPKVAYKAMLKFLQVPAEYTRLQKTLKETSFKTLQEQEEKQGFKEKPAGMKRFFASGKAGGWVEHLTPEQVDRIHSEFKPTIEEFFPEIGEQAAAFVAGK